LRLLLADSDVQVIGEADRLESPEFSGAEADVLIYASASAPLTPFKCDAPGVALLLLSDDPPPLQSLRRAGAAWGSLPLESSREELIAAINALAEGLMVGSARSFQARPAAADPGAQPLSEREMEVLGLLAQGLANKQIAGALGITEHTIKFHVSSIYSKMNVTNRAEAVRQGVRQGLIAI
jgi:DNA-binding NarL/FixJ family response regulator